MAATNKSKKTTRKRYRTPPGIKFILKQAKMSHGAYYGRRRRGLSHNQAMGIKSIRTAAIHDDHGCMNEDLMAGWAAKSSEIQNGETNNTLGSITAGRAGARRGGHTNLDRANNQ
jgi:hypothetical protein